jgi:hypothetical protein
MRTRSQYNADNSNKRQSEINNKSKLARTSLWDVTDIRTICLAETQNVNITVEPFRVPQEFTWDPNKSAFKRWTKN